MLVCPVCDYVDLVKDRFKMHLQTHGLPATDLTSLVRESERDFTTLLSCDQPGCSFTTAYKRGLVTHQAMEHRLPYNEDDERLKDIRKFPQPSTVIRLPPLLFKALAGIEAKMASRLTGQHTLTLAFEKTVRTGRACIRHGDDRCGLLTFHHHPRLPAHDPNAYHTYSASNRYQGDVIDLTKSPWQVVMVVTTADQLCPGEFSLVDVDETWSMKLTIKLH